MSLTQKLSLFCLLLVSGTSWLVSGMADSEARRRFEAQEMDSCRKQVGTIVEVLGAGLLADVNAQTATKDPVLATLRKLVDRVDDTEHKIYTITDDGGRVVIVREARREGPARKPGTPVELSHAGYRAHRTRTVEQELIETTSGTVLRTFCPIPPTDSTSAEDSAADAKGKPARSNETAPRSGAHTMRLLVTESAIDHITADTRGWSTLAISLAAGILALAILVIGVARPLQRLQTQLVVKQDLAPKLVRRPSDLLREITRIIDRASSDRDYFETLIRQKEQLRESSMRKKDEVIANTVHELRTPLTSIIASLEIVSDSDSTLTDEEECEFLLQASTAARHMMFVINDMLDAAAIEAGQIHMHIEQFNLQRVLIDAQRSMEIVATARSMTLQVAEVDPEITVMADCARLMQVVFNLVSNAVKYTPSGTTITIRAWPSLKSVIIEVEDEGECIPVEKRDRLFTKFSTIERESTEPPVESAGIGLYISRKLVELMHGSIGYRASESGTGSVFWFTLPLITEDANAISQNRV